MRENYPQAFSFAQIAWPRAWGDDPPRYAGPCRNEGSTHPLRAITIDSS